MYRVNMMKDVLLTSLICCLIRSLGTSAFNIDVASRVVFDGPSKSKFFGYSVALHSYQNRYWALVGAPLSNVTTGSGTYSKYGAAFKCEYTGSQQCSLISIDYSAPRRDQGVFLEEKSGQWLGAVVYSTGKDGKALACAPRYIWRGVPDYLATGTVHYRWLLGRCFRLNSDLSSAVHNGELNPCDKETKGNLHYGYCQAGFSAKYTIDGYDVIMGAVGPNQWKGGLILYTEGVYIKTPFDQLEYADYMGYAVASGKFSNQLGTEVVGGAPRADELKGKALIYDYSSEQFAVTSPLPQPKDLKTGSYFGSVICAVDLDNNQYTDVLVGAPYYTHVKDEGRVYMYLNNGQGALNLQDTVLEGDKKVNAHFGAAIASVGDLNADGFQDVAIGAPMEGDDGSGAVYIYQGSSKGIELPYAQKIIGSMVKAGIKMFGISIAGNVDIDKNRYPDIVVGAYGSENAVIMRSQAIVNVDGAIELSKQRVTLESNDSLCDVEGDKLKCLNVTVVLSYNDAIPDTKSTDLHVKFTIDLDKDKDRLRRMFFWDKLNNRRQFALETNYTLAAPNTKYRLAPKTVYLDKEEVGDVNSQLTFDVILSQPQPPCGGLCPALNAHMATTFRAEIPFEKKCRNQVTCSPDLALSGKVDFNPKSNIQELRLGVVKDFVLQLTIENKATDSAYLSKIKLKYPDSLNYIGPDEGVECSRSPSDNGTTTVTCDVGNPLLGKATKSFGIKFSPGSVTENFVLEVEASSQDKDTNEKDNKKTFSVAVKFEADVEIKGSSKQDTVVYQGPVRSEEEVRKSLDSVGPEVIQTLSVRNNGPSDVDGSVVTVNFPNLYSSSKSDSYLLYLLMVELDGVSGSCDAKVNPLDIKAGNATSQENTQSRKRRDTEGNTLLGCRKAQCKSFKCSLGLLKMGDSVNIKLTFRLWENTLLKELDTPRAVDLETSAKVKVPDKIAQPDEDNDETTIITTASPAKTEAQEKTPWWVIFLSVLGGVLLLAGAVAVLYKLGFFKRKRVKDISGPMEENVPMNTK